MAARENPRTVPPDGVTPPPAAPPTEASRFRNRTAHRICISAKDGSGRLAVQIPPYGEWVAEAPEAASLDLEPWLTRGIVTCDPVKADPSVLRFIGEGLLGGALGVGVWAGIIWVLWDVFGTPPASFWPTALAVGLVLGLALAHFRFREEGGRSGLFRTAFGKLGRPLSFGRALAGDVANAAAVLVVAVGVPAAVILAAGAWAPVMASGAGQDGIPVGEWLAAQLDDRAFHLTGRGMQLTLIALLSSLPAALYFLFDRRKLESLRQRFLRSVLVLDPDLRTLDDVVSVYGARVNEVLGGATEGGRRPPVGLTRQVMVPLTTLILAVGWTVALDPVGGAAGVDTLAAYVTPRPEPMVFAFLGGYLFAIGMLLRRYVRSDLKPETLAHALVRILGAILMAWTVGAIVPEAGTPVVLAIAFTIGVFPESGMDSLTEHGRSLMASRLGKSEGPQLSEAFPLDWLDGVNVYHRSRLMDEGVDNLENLAHADLVDLVLETRIPMGTLVDWVDQAIVVLHTRSGRSDPGHYETLREYGIRTATDLEQAWEEALARGEADEFLGMLGAREGGPRRLRVLLDALADDQWMAQLRQARAAERGRLTLTAERLPLWDQGEDRLAEEVERLRPRSARRRAGTAPRTPEATETLPAPHELGPAGGDLPGEAPPPEPGMDLVGDPVIPVLDGDGREDQAEV